ncbi:hypothetical protein AAFF_G00061730 [Aldrovandia affinis]|uniref:Uncharacterized protein n=1 Tax=Aldrovandia affinis TaxID=143900 RepID=A0AAD7VXR4_9TELE|nr:hypothetical protein AAFF_G00061730 [Aldrovandia affinis]
MDCNISAVSTVMLSALAVAPDVGSGSVTPSTGESRVPDAWPAFTSSGHQYLEMNDKINRDSVQQKLRIPFVHYWTETSVAGSSGGLVDITRNFPGPFEGILFSTATACTVGSRMPGRCS